MREREEGEERKKRMKGGKEGRGELFPNCEVIQRRASHSPFKAYSLSGPRGSIRSKCTLPWPSAGLVCGIHPTTEATRLQELGDADSKPLEMDPLIGDHSFPELDIPHHHHQGSGDTTHRSIRRVGRLKPEHRNPVNPTVEGGCQQVSDGPENTKPSPIAFPN